MFFFFPKSSFGVVFLQLHASRLRPGGALQLGGWSEGAGHRGGELSDNTQNVTGVSGKRLTAASHGAQSHGTACGKEIAAQNVLSYRRTRVHLAGCEVTHVFAFPGVSVAEFSGG